MFTTGDIVASDTRHGVILTARGTKRCQLLAGSVCLLGTAGFVCRSMSLPGFVDDAQQVRVFIPPVKKLPPNPHIGRGSDALLRALAPPSETAGTDSEWPPESPEDKSLRHRLLACDQRSFFTGSASADLQAAYIISAVRRNPERNILVVSLLFRVAFNV